MANEYKMFDEQNNNCSVLNVDNHNIFNQFINYITLVSIFDVGADL